MKYLLSICALLLLAFSSSSAQMAVSHASTAAARPSTAGPQLAGKPVARVNGAVLTDRDLLREEFMMFPYARQHNGSIPQEMEPEIRKGAMKMMIFEELVYQDALRRHMTIPPARMQRAEVEFRKQFQSPGQYQQVLQEEFHGSPRLLREKIRRSLLIEALLKLEVEDKAAISVAQAKAYYDKNPDKFRMPESFAFQTISMVPPENANAAQLKEARKRAEDALRQAKATKSYDEFGLLAEKISEDDYRVNMGDHKAVARAQLPPQVVQALLAMQPGQISDVIQVGQILTIVRLKAHIPAGIRNFDEVKVPLREKLQKDKTEQLRSSLNKQLRRNAKIEEL